MFVGLDDKRNTYPKYSGCIIKICRIYSLFACSCGKIMLLLERKVAIYVLKNLESALQAVCVYFLNRLILQVMYL